MRRLATAQERDPAPVKAFIGICPVLGRTVKKAKAKYAEALAHADPLAGQTQVCRYSGIDLTDFNYRYQNKSKIGMLCLQAMTLPMKCTPSAKGFAVRVGGDYITKKSQGKDAIMQP
jgi:alkanesulfonate monooxygenase SsuD/methylene tetrahydromethanopterin reductase-like flavin-dependent oxidoreductase (luciferase family)